MKGKDAQNTGSLNKPKDPNNMILGLQNKEGIIKKRTRKMVEITSSYHNSSRKSHK